MGADVDRADSVQNNAPVHFSCLKVLFSQFFFFEVCWRSSFLLFEKEEETQDFLQGKNSHGSFAY